jgi:hypothetical protein
MISRSFLRRRKEMRSGVVSLNSVCVVLAVVLVCAFARAAFGDYCTASGGGSTETYISGVEVGDINNAGTAADGYVDYTALSTTMEIRTGYGITVTNGAPYDEYDQCGVWVDWNADGDFEEPVEAISMTGGPATFTGLIRPPEGAALASMRMRVRIRWKGTLEPCGDTPYGEVEDYTIVVIEEKSYEIWTAGDLQAIGADANYWDKHFRLMADIDLSAYTGTSFNIIGRGLTKFTGVFDGNGHTISNFTYDSNGRNDVGLFGHIDDANAEIKNVGLINANVIGRNNVGSLAAELGRGAIRDCYIEGGSVLGIERVGGLAGFNSSGTISNCYVDETSVSGSGNFVGGLVGFNGGSVSGSYSTGSVSGDWYVGGLAGYSLGQIGQCYSASDVIGNTFTGGLVGNNGGDMGIGSIANSYSTGTVAGISSTGGLVGFNAKGDIMNCCSTASVSGGGNVGGLVGYNYMGSVSNSYSASSLDGDNYLGGLAGYSLAGNYTKCFWDVNVNPDVNGISNVNDPDVIGKTTVQMHTQSTYTDSGWDFTTPIWKMNCEAMSCPKLSWWQPVLGDFNCPDGVDWIDLAVLCEQWLFEELSADVAPDGGDGFVNFLDWGVFAEKWQITVDFGDLADFADQWLKTGANHYIADVAPDLGDGIVNVADFAVLADSWLAGM